MVTRQKKSKKTLLRWQDPYLEREKLKYEKPLPSREFLLQILEEKGVPLYPEELAKLFSIQFKEIEFFERRLLAMERAGQVIINRKGAVCVPKKLDIVACQVLAHKDGYGFARPENQPEDTVIADFFLNEREMRKVMHLDRVMVRPSGTDRKGRVEAKIVEIIEHASKTLVAKVEFDRGVWIGIAEDKRIQHDILIAPNDLNGATDKQIAVLEIVEYPDSHHPIIAKVIEILGNQTDPGMEIEIALRKHDLPHVFPEDVQAQAKATPKKVRKKDLSKDREDLRELPLVTIDGETARDFDDAVYAEKSGKGFRLVVAIADVSHYVQPNDALDQEAQKRGTSVYFPRRVIPMLPEALSNGICSLNPDVERLCMVCDMVINANGEVKRYRFYPAVMKSQARLTYNQVWDWIQNGTDSPLMPHIATLYELYQRLVKVRAERGAIEFDTVETQMIFNDQGKIDKIVPVVRNDAHKLIEECMLAANVCAADYLIANEHKGLFRVHEGPTPEKLDALRQYLRLTGLTLGGGDKPSTKDYAILSEQVRGRPDAAALQTMLLRSMQQATYTPENNGHFGLAYEAYAHFTSPIRRYPDLLVHRSIKAILKGERYRPSQKWTQLGIQCSTTERRAEEASRDVESWLKTYYMRDKIGETYTGKINAVTSFGLFVLLDNLYIEGLVHISELGKDYFIYKKEMQSIIGEKSGIAYRLGDTVTVKVVRAELESSQVDFELIKAPNITSAADPVVEAETTRRPRSIKKMLPPIPEEGSSMETSPNSRRRKPRVSRAAAGQNSPKTPRQSRSRKPSANSSNNRGPKKAASQRRKRD